MNFFRTIREILTPPIPTDVPVLPFNLTRDDLRQLGDLRDTPEFSIFLELLDTVAIFYGEQLLVTTDYDRLLDLRGTINGLRRAGTLIDDLQTQDKQRNARPNASRPDPDSRARALVSTPFWG